jgi:hypothetical protein
VQAVSEMQKSCGSPAIFVIVKNVQMRGQTAIHAGKLIVKFCGLLLLPFHNQLDLSSENQGSVTFVCSPAYVESSRSRAPIQRSRQALHLFPCNVVFRLVIVHVRK